MKHKYHGKKGSYQVTDKDLAQAKTEPIGGNPPGRCPPPGANKKPSSGGEKTFAGKKG